MTQPNSTQPAPHIVVVCDSISNSVFLSQVVAPLRKHAVVHSVIIVSFERTIPSIQQQEQIRQALGPIQLIVYKRSAYWGMLSLMPSAYKLRNILSKHTGYTLQARGALSGLICQWAAQQQCIQLIIQARGLLAEEYRYAHKKTLLHSLRAWQLERLEKRVYGKPGCAQLEAVSEAMAAYLQKQFNTPATTLTIATLDVPQTIDPKIRAAWRTEGRNRLGVAEATTVYCYSGSALAWQCPKETVTLFKEKLQEDHDVFLLILTTNIETFRTLTTDLPENKYALLQVPADQVLKHLAIADIGILLREQHPVNWVSRPTKALEYQAAGLRILHNNTVAWLKNMDQIGGEHLLQSHHLDNHQGINL